MDTTSKLFIFMIVLALVIGAFVIKFKPQHNLATVYKSNARYYPHINDETVLKKIQKPKSAVVEDNAGVSISTSTGVHKAKKKKIDTDEFIPD
ncbi:MAG TPA: hypothetical protein DCX95_01310 [Elusimicrobia bacterium]|nr:hypothetical protein [Elusimicrobiota bacterium]